MAKMNRKKIFCIDWEEPEMHASTEKKLMCKATIINEQGNEEIKWVDAGPKTKKPVKKAFRDKVDAAQAKQIMKERAEKAVKKSAKSSRKSTAKSSRKSTAKSTAQNSAAVSDVPLEEPELVDTEETILRRDPKKAKQRAVAMKKALWKGKQKVLGHQAKILKGGF